MALSISNLSSELKTQLETFFAETPIDDTRLEEFCDAVATAVVDHIKNNAVVHVAVPGVQTGGSTINVDNGTIT